MPSGIGRAAAVEAADHAAGWLPDFASALHPDARAPVNLTPTIWIDPAATPPGIAATGRRHAPRS